MEMSNAHSNTKCIHFQLHFETKNDIICHLRGLHSQSPTNFSAKPMIQSADANNDLRLQC